MYSRKRDPCRTFDAWMRWFEIDDAQADGRDAGSGEGLCVLRSGRPRTGRGTQDVRGWTGEPGETGAYAFHRELNLHGLLP